MATAIPSMQQSPHTNDKRLTAKTRACSSKAFLAANQFGHHKRPVTEWSARERSSIFNREFFVTFLRFHSLLRQSRECSISRLTGIWDSRGGSGRESTRSLVLRCVRDAGFFAFSGFLFSSLSLSLSLSIHLREASLLFLPRPAQVAFRKDKTKKESKGRCGKTR